jgi:hypothetical protein
VAEVVEAADWFDAGGDLGGSPVAAAEAADVDPAAARDGTAAAASQPTYSSLQQVTQAVRLGCMQPGDQLPTVNAVVAQLRGIPQILICQCAVARRVVAP